MVVSARPAGAAGNESHTDRDGRQDHAGQEHRDAAAEAPEQLEVRDHRD